MDQKRDAVRNQSTEQLFSQDRPADKRLESAEEAVQQTGLNQEELFLQNIFIDKQERDGGISPREAENDFQQQDYLQPSPVVFPPPATEGDDLPSFIGQAERANLEKLMSPDFEFTPSQAGDKQAYRAHATNFQQVADTAVPGVDSASASGIEHGQDNLATGDSSALPEAPGALLNDTLQIPGALPEKAAGDDGGAENNEQALQPEAGEKPDPVPQSVQDSTDTGPGWEDTATGEDKAADTPQAGTESTHSVEPTEVPPSPTPTPATGPEVLPSNSPPVVGAVDLGSTAEDTAFTISSSDLLAETTDVDGDDLQVTGVSVEQVHGSFEDNEDGSWTFRPAEDYHGDDVPVQFTVSDGTETSEGQASLNVAAVNDAPVVGAVDLGSTAEDTAVTISSSDLLAETTDVDGDDLQVTGVGVEEVHGSFEDNEDGSWTFRPAEDYHGDDVPVQFTVSDGEDSSQGQASLNVAAVNDAPVVGAVDLGSTAEDTAVTISSSDLLAQASDIDGDELQVTGVSVDAAHGSVQDNDDGSWTFRPAQNYHGDDVPLQFTVSDGNASTQATASLDIIEVSIEGVSLVGTSGNDTLIGTDGDDVLVGARGDDTLIGGAGNDTFEVVGNAGLDQVDGGEGHDTIQGSRYNDTIQVSDNLDNIHNVEAIDGGDGYDVLQGGRGDDVIDLSDGPALTSIEEVDGGYGDDTIIGTAGDDTIEGNRGNDTLSGGGGDDTFKVYGNAGLDQVDGGEGHDTIQGSRYNDTIQISDNLDNIHNVEAIDGGDGYDVLQGGSGNDVIDLSDGPVLQNIEEIDGGYGDDTIIGTAGDDTIEGNRGNDTLSGGGGDDTFKVYGNAGLDQVDGGEGYDTIEGSRYGDTIQVSNNLDNFQDIEAIDGGDGYDVLQGGSGDDVIDLSDGPVLQNIEEIDGGYGDDTIIGTAGDDTIEGNRGNDTLSGGAGDDTFKVYGNAGLDQVDGGEGYDTIEGSRYGDTIQVSNNLDNFQDIEAIDGGDGYDVLQGGSGDDVIDLSDGPVLQNIEEIDGGYGDDTIIGTAGDDTIEGNRGNDTLSGGAGDDTFKVYGNAGLDQVDGGEGHDTIQGSRYGDTIQVSDNLDNIQGVETIDGGDGYDVLQGGSGDEVIDLSNGPALNSIEEIDGGYGNDTITGSAGDDNIDGNRGDDSLAGGSGNDHIDGGLGSDRLTLQGMRSEYHISQNEDNGYTITDSVEERDGTDTIENIELVEFQDQIVGVDDLLVEVEAETAPAAEIGGDDLSNTLETVAEPESAQGDQGNQSGKDNQGNQYGKDNQGNQSGKDNQGNQYGKDNQGNQGNQFGKDNDTPAGGDDELLYAMEASTGAEGEQGWAESVQMEASESAPTSLWDEPADTAQDEADLAASAMDLTADTTGVVSMTEGANGGLEGLETVEG